MHPKLAFLSVVPSPYQRDLFAALARRNRVDLQVYYLERSAPDSPWPEVPLATYEDVLPGVTLGRARWRSHCNWRLPVPQPDETWVVNGAMTDVTTQRLLRRLGRRTRWYFWGELPSQPSRPLRRWLQRRQYAPLRHAQAIVAIGERARRAYQLLLPGLQVLNQPYVCQLEAFHHASLQRRGSEEAVFLFCGQMILRKGIDILLAAFAKLINQGVSARLLLVGREGDVAQHLALLDTRTREKVTNLGFQAPAKLPTIFAEANVFVLPSRHDGWGVVVNQALGSGLAVVCSDGVLAANDLIRTSENGLIVPAGDVDALADALRQLAEDSSLREALGRAAAHAAERLTPDISATFWEACCTA